MSRPVEAPEAPFCRAAYDELERLKYQGKASAEICRLLIQHYPAGVLADCEGCESYSTEADFVAAAWREYERLGPELDRLVLRVSLEEGLHRLMGRTILRRILVEHYGIAERPIAPGESADTCAGLPV